MANENEGIQVGIDSSGAKTGEGEVIRSLENIKAKTKEVGDAGGEAGRKSKKGMDDISDGARQAETAVERLKQRLAAAVTGGNMGQAEAIRKQIAEIQSLGGAYGGLTGKMGNARIAQMELMHVVRAGGDQFAAGANPIQIFAMQIGRVAEAASFMGPQLGKVGALMQGPWGLAIVAGIIGLATLANHFRKATDDDAELIKKLQEHEQKAQATERANAAFAVTLDGVSAAARDNKKALDDLNNAQDSAAHKVLVSTLTEQGHIKVLQDSTRALLENARAQLLVTQAQAAQSGSMRDSGAAEETRILQEKVDKLTKTLAGADAAAKSVNDRVEQAIGHVAMEAGARMADPIERIKHMYEGKGGLIDQERARLKAAHATTEEYARQGRILAAREAAEIKAAQASKRKPHDYNYETKDFTSAEVRAIVGGHVSPLGGHRTYAQQKMLYDRYIAYREGRGPFANVAARPGTGDHETDHALDITGKTVAQVREAATKAHIPIKQLFWEVDHVHFAWRKVGEGINKATQEAERQVKIDEDIKLNTMAFWLNLQGAAKVAGMLPGEAEKYSKELELQKILAGGVLANIKPLTPEMKTQIDLLVDQANINKLITEIELDKKKALFEQHRLLDEQVALQGNTADQIEEQLAVEEKLWPYKQKMLEQGLDLQDETIKGVLAELAARERTNYQIAMRNRLIQEGNKLVDDMLDEADPLRKVQRDYQKDLQRIGASTRPQGQKDKALEQLNKDFAKDMNDIQAKFYEDMIENVHKIGNALGGAFGEIIDAIGSLAVMLQQMAQATYQAGTVGAKANNPVSQVASGLQSLTTQLQSLLGQGSPLFKAFGSVAKALGDFSDGAAVGQQVAGIAKALGWKKFSTTGAEIGGGIGKIASAVTGIPGLEIVGSILGGFIGSLFKKTKQASATITSAYGQADVTGNSGKYRDAARALATGVQSGLLQIASALGAQLGSFAVSIGERKGRFIVDETGRGRLKGPGTPSFGTEEEAIAYAILDAIRDGALRGLSAATERILRGATIDNLDQLLKAAQTYEELARAAKAAANPMGAAFGLFIANMQQTMEMLKAAGYTYEELAALGGAFAEQQKAILKELTQGYKDFLEEITSGGLSGKTLFQQFTDAYDKFHSMITAGGFSQDDFTSQGQTLLQLAAKVYGTATPQYEAVRQELITATQNAINAANQAAADALNSEGIIAAIGDTNAILTAILNNLFGANTTGGTPSTSGNGSATGASGYSYSGGGGTSLGGGSYGSYTGSGGGGGMCVTADSLVMMYDGSEKVAGDLQPGDAVWTQHEDTWEWGAYEVLAVETAELPVVERQGWPTATPNHRFALPTWLAKRLPAALRWFRAGWIGRKAGVELIVKLTVAEAHTYVARHPKPGSPWRLSHNIKIGSGFAAVNY